MGQHPTTSSSTRIPLDPMRLVLENLAAVLPTVLVNGFTGLLPLDLKITVPSTVQPVSFILGFITIA
eukprot:2957893-Rhodomonas_salina.4